MFEKLKIVESLKKVTHKLEVTTLDFETFQKLEECQKILQNQPGQYSQEIVDKEKANLLNKSLEELVVMFEDIKPTTSQPDIEKFRALIEALVEKDVQKFVSQDYGDKE